MAQKKTEIPENIQLKWQRIVNMIGCFADVPASLIMKVHSSQIEVFIASEKQNNPYEKGEKADLNTGLYCEMVMNKRQFLHIPNALADTEWDHNPDIELGMTYYLGFPLQWPNGKLFGTICILDVKDNLKATMCKDMLFEFKEVIENDLRFMLESSEKEKLVIELQSHKKILEQKVEARTIELKNRNNELSREIKEHKQARQMIQAIAESTAGVVGKDFFNQIVSTLCQWLDCEISLIGRVFEDLNVDVLAMQVDNKIIHNYTYNLIGTPCENVHQNRYCVYPEKVAELFPDDKNLVELGVEGYVGSPLKNGQGETIGILAVLSRKKFILPDKAQNVMEIIAARASAEIERSQIEDDLNLSKERLEALLRLTQMEGSSEKELADFALEEAVRLTRSLGGYFHFFNAHTQEIRLSSWSKEVLKICDSPMDTHYPLDDAGIWADSIRTGQPVIHNGYQTLDEKKGYPEGHFPVLRHMSVPVFDGNRIIGIAGVGNKQRPYDKSDIDQLTLLMTDTWRIIQKGKAEKALFASEEKYRSMMELMDDAVYICNSDYRIAYMNKAMMNTTGHDATGEFCYNVLHDRDSKCHWCAFDKILQGKSAKYEIVSPKDKRSYHVSNMPLRMQDGSVSKLTIYHDITEIKRMQQQLQQKQKLEAIGTLAGGIAHDFNNILSAMIGFTELAKIRAQNDEKLKIYLEQVLSAGIRARDLVKHILTFSRRTDIQKREISIIPLIKESIQLIQASIPKNIQIKKEFDGMESSMMGDPTQVLQMVMNLYANAAQSMKEKGGVLKVRLKEIDIYDETMCRKERLKKGRYVELIISDTGCGIPNDIIDKIFDPFFTTKERGEGTGMGLSIVHGIVKEMGGTISVDSEIAKGTAFKILFPVHGRSESVVTPLKSDLSKGRSRILFIDDEQSIVDSSVKILSNLGYEVVGMISGQKALEAFKQNTEEFDLVLTDLTMSGLNGLDLSKELLKIRPDIPIILSTGFSEGLTSKRVKDMGIYEMVMKPVMASELAELVNRALAKGGK